MTKPGTDEHNLATFARLVRDAGGDPDAELITARVAHGHPPAVWAAIGVAAHYAHEPIPDPVGPGHLELADRVADGFDDGFGNPPEALWAMSAPPAVHLLVPPLHASLVPGWLADAFAAGVHQSARVCAAYQARTSRTVRHRLAGDPDPSVRRALANSCFAPVAALVRLAADPDGEVRQAVATNPVTPDRTLHALVNAQDQVVAFIAGDTITMRAEHATQARSQDPVTRQRAIRSHSMSASTLAELAGDDRMSVRELVADHLAARPSILRALAGDRSELVRSRVAAHPAIDDRTLARLADDPDEQVRARAAATLEHLDQYPAPPA